MTEHEAIERIVLAQEAQTLALECINRQLFQIREMMQESRDEATDEEG